MTKVLNAMLVVLVLAGVVQAQDKSPRAGGGAQATVNLNTATVAQLEALPGIGQKTAERIIEYRQKVGGFKKVEDVMNVRGVGEKGFLKLKPMLTLGAAKAEKP